MSTPSADARTDGTVPAAPATAPAGEHHVPHRWTVLAVIGLAQLMVVLDATIVNIALPSAQKELGFNNDDRQWIITGYSLAFGSLLLLGGRLADLFGRRRTFLIGLIGFCAASALGGAAPDFHILVTARALQGMFGALLAPSALSLLTTTFIDPQERSKAFGIFGAIAGSGGAIGLLLGGVLTEHLDWRWTLYVNVVIAVFAAIGAVIFLQRQAPAARPRLDLPGTVLVAAGLFSLVYGFSNAETKSWGNPWSWGFLIACGVLLTLFVIRESRAEHPLLPLRVLRDRNRAGSFLSVFLSGAGMFGVFLFLTYYLQTTLGYSPVSTGLGFLPMVGALMVTAQLSTRVLIPGVGPKPVIPVGMGLAAGGLVWLTRLELHSTYPAHVLPPLLMLGVGLGLVMPPAMSLATLGVRAHDQGVASATVNTMQQVGGSIGTALFNTVAATAATNYAKDHPRKPNLSANASLHSYATAYWWAAGFFVVGLVITVLVFRRGRPEHLADPIGEPLAADGGQSGDTVTEPTPRPAPLATDARHMAEQREGVRGRVLAEGGGPVADAAVTLIDQNGRQLSRSTTSQDGWYTLDAPDSGSHVLVASAPGRRPHVSTITVRSEPSDVNVVLGETGGLVGTVRSEGETVPGALVVATDSGGDVVQSATTDEEGRYRLTGLPGGSYTLTISAPGRRPVADPVVFDEDAPTRHDVELAHTTTLRGTVRGRTGSPLPDARVTLLDPEGNVAAQHITGEDGAYAFADLAGAHYTVVASGYPPVALPVEIGELDGENFDVALKHEDHA